MQITLFGLRYYNKSALPRIIFNRFVHLTGYHFCYCNRFLKKDEMYGVVLPDCLMCPECCLITNTIDGDPHV